MYRTIYIHMYICLISKIHREPCLDGKKKHIAPLKLVPDLPLQGLPKSFASCALVPSALQGLPKKLCYIQISIANFNGEGPSVLPCSRCPGNAGMPSSHPSCSVQSPWVSSKLLCCAGRGSASARTSHGRIGMQKYRGALHFNSSQLWTPSGFPSTFSHSRFKTSM